MGLIERWRMHGTAHGLPKITHGRELAAGARVDVVLAVDYETLAAQHRGAVDDLGVALDLLARARCTDLGTDDKSWWRAERLRLTAKWGQ